MLKLDSKQLRVKVPTSEERKKIKKNPVFIILDNVLDTYNVGAIFRLADAAAVQRVYLCGMTEIPPNSRIKKASINTTEWVDWEVVASAASAVLDLKARVPDLKVFAVELDDRSIPYYEADYSFPVALVVGHETDGVTSEVLDIVDQIVEIPMWGVNKSLNVMVSLGIVLFEAMKRRV
jgi:23S rRNA (guanosine2251-2'-O)-methyltransferase